MPTKDGRELRTINESVHPSVWQRLNQGVPILSGERESRKSYEPINLPPQAEASTWVRPEGTPDQ